MPSRQDCLDDIARKTGRKREDVQDILSDILDRADAYEHDGLSPDESYAKARDEMLAEIGEQTALRRRAEILDTRKTAARHNYYKQTETAIAGLKVQRLIGSSEKLKGKLEAEAPKLALEAKLVGVNLPIPKGRLSVDAQYVALRRAWVGGFSQDLERAGLDKIFASRAIEDKWTDELFQLNRGRDGSPGITKDKQALEIARIVQKWQRVGMSAINREGGWVRSYSGYITRTSHDADRIRRAGPLKWASDVLPRLDLRRTFGTADRQHALDMLHQMFDPMAKGDHFDYGRPLEEPLYPSLANKASATRELHFKSGKDWRAYNEDYGVSNPTQTVVSALSIGARRVALMKEFGTKPAEAFEHDIQFIKATLQAESKSALTSISALETALGSPSADEAAKAKISAEIAELKARVDKVVAKFQDFQRFTGKDKIFGSPAHNRFAQIDGTSQKPVSRTMANVTSNWMAIQRMAKLGRVYFTHFASLVTKAAEAKYWGIGLAERYSRLFSGMTQGLEGSVKRQALDATLIAFENRLGHMMAMYDVADAPAGFLAKWETTFFKLTGVSSVVDNQRGDAEAMFASHLGAKRDQTWADVGPKEQRVLKGFGIAEPEWKALHGVEWSKLGDRTYLFPADAMKLSDDQVKAYLAEKGAFGRFSPPGDADIAKAREDLALQIAAAYSDRAGYAIPMPSARIRAMLFQNAFEPGTGLNIALKLLYQFKLWPADMVVRGWGREIYGRIEDGRMDKVAGLAEFAVGSIVFGVASEAVRELIQGKNPIAEIRGSPLGAILKGGQRSGFGSLVGDFLLGEFDRHGFSAVGSLAGPTFSQIDTLVDLLHAGGRTKEGTLGKVAMRERAADLIKLTKDNTPFMSLWATSWALDTLIWHRLQEWINPGYLARAERRQQQQQGTQFIVSPAKTDQWITGRRASPF
jgi:hypothetical protein